MQLLTHIENRNSEEEYLPVWVNAKPVDLAPFTGLLFVHHNPMWHKSMPYSPSPYKWVVTDGPSGLRVGLGYTKKDAIDDAFRRMESRGIDTVEALDKLRKNAMKNLGIKKLLNPDIT